MTTVRSGLLRTAATVSRWLPLRVKLWAYRIPIVTPLIRRALNRAAPTGLSAVRIAGGALSGMSMQLDLQREKYYWLGTYEPEMQSTIGELVRAGSTVYDVGAHVGFLTLNLAKAVGAGGTVIAFEALAGNAERIRRNVVLNDLTDVIHVEPVAVSDAVGSAEFLVHESPSMGKLSGSAGRDADYPGRVRVDTVTLDAYVLDQGHPAPDLVKLDIEGGEVRALPGMERVLRICRPRVLLELHGSAAADIAWSTFRRARYVVRRLGNGSEVRSRSDLDWKEHLLAEPDPETCTMHAP